MSISTLKPAQRCRANVASGGRCSRYCAAGSTLCSKHSPDAKPTGVIAAQDTDDVVVLLRRMTKDREPSIRLRAIEAILKWEERNVQACATCAANAKLTNDSRRFIEYASDAQRERLGVVLAEFYALRADVQGYIDRGGTPNVPAEPTPDAPTPDAPMPDAPMADTETPDAPAAPRTSIPPPLTDEERERAGLVVINGRLTHAKGDEHAEKILSREIPTEQAAHEHAEASRQIRLMARSAISH